MLNYGDWGKTSSPPYPKWTVTDKESGFKVLDEQSIQHVIFFTKVGFTLQITCKRTENKTTPVVLPFYRFVIWHLRNLGTAVITTPENERAGKGSPHD